MGENFGIGGSSLTFDTVSHPPANNILTGWGIPIVKVLRASIALALAASVIPVAAQALVRHYQLNIPRQPLDSAIKEFAQQTGLQIARFSDVATSKTIVGPLTGDFSVDGALKSLLSTSGLGYRLVNERTIAVVDHGDGQPVANALLAAGAPTATVPAANAGTVETAATDSTSQGPQQQGLTEIIVTAMKRDTPLMNTPVAITSIQQDALTEGGVTNANDLSKMVPNLQMGRDPNAGGVQIAIRGISSNNFTEFGSSSVSFNADGVYLPRSQAALTLLFDTERVEVDRGPQGTLWGRNSPGGAINIISAPPTFDKTYGEVAGDLGNYHERLFSGSVNLPVNEILAIRAAFTIHKRDGWVDQQSDQYIWNPGGGIAPSPVPVTDQTFNHAVSPANYYYNANDWAGRLTALFVPTDGLSEQLTFEHYADDSAGVVGMPDCSALQGSLWACSGGRQGFSPYINAPGKLDLTQNSLRSITKVALGSQVEASLRVGYTKEDRSQIVDNDAGYWPVFTQDPRVVTYSGGGNFSPIGSPSQLKAIGGGSLWPYEDFTTDVPWSHYDSINTELLLQSQGTQKVDWTVGYFNLQERNSIDYEIQNPICCNTPPWPQALSFIQPDRHIISNAAFGQLDFHTTDKLTLTGGYRYTWDEQTDNGGHNYSDQATGFYGGTFNNNAGTFNPLGYQSWSGGYAPGYGPSGTWYNSANYAGVGIFSNQLKQVTTNSASDSWKKGTFRVNAGYMLDSRNYIYASYATGYRAGGFQDPEDHCNCGEIFVPKWNPETVGTAEIGYRGRLLDNHLSLLATIFHSKYQNMQVTSDQQIGASLGSGTTPGTPLYALNTTNIGQATINGLELEYDARLWSGGRLSGFFTYLPTKINSDPDQSGSSNWACSEVGYIENNPNWCAQHYYEQAVVSSVLKAEGVSPVGLINAAGNKLPYSPVYSMTFNAEQKYQILPTFYLRGTASVHWQSIEFFTVDNFNVKPYVDGQGAFAKLDLSLRFAPVSDIWYVEAYGLNVTDKMTANAPNPESSLGVQQRFQWDDPAFYGVRMSYKFK